MKPSTIAIIVALVIATGQAEAQEYSSSHLYVGVPGVSQKEVEITSTQPFTATVGVGQLVEFNTRSNAQYTVATTGLVQPMSQVDPDRVYGGYDISIEATMTNETGIINFVDSQGRSSTVLVIQPIVVQTEPNSTWQILNIPENSIVYGSLILAAVVIGGVIIVKKIRRMPTII